MRGALLKCQLKSCLICSPEIESVYLSIWVVDKPFHFQGNYVLPVLIDQSVKWLQLWEMLCIYLLTWLMYIHHFTYIENNVLFSKCLQYLQLDQLNN